MILLIDNYDSFTYNLAQQIETLGTTVRVISHDKITLAEIQKIAPQKIVISPGPKGPKDSGISLQVIKRLHTHIPILGVCLGHECIGEVFGVKVVKAKKPMHGKTSKIHHRNTSLFAGLKNPFTAARYHSLILEKVPDECLLTAWTSTGEIMAVQHKMHPLYGIQFHPESFLTPEGNTIMHNFLSL